MSWQGKREQKKFCERREKSEAELTNLKNFFIISFLCC
ncbi:hypothetical protein L499_A2475 [Bordetella holmesii CDC-H635-BH]|uniref:Uncharacterized protein n=1 Tax=Bordetella holmesii CDC-H585-BH TaxID=1331206 RepID=A0A158M0Z3_9BORD|nr:hypothetical protein D557_4082 [Bordetella holmesii 70147]KAK86093.1 hypothetical protein L496_2436 [Bordetella holmesii CDC-H572-BH]KAK86664.1 hypothetical protein L497_2469 [Bordetella holmesii CDC-H585-BH]KAK97630.1 hypothetical protein L499_A2475 [Bordetella holmesii CDC-H635-BH]KCV07020.1 hypothetical protein L502_2438 [Bordetella holmesii CDC-H785-BH]KCV13532.1 hypothetical protein L500_0802 [Bordetella holmesii CDC-H643-BH]